MFSELDARKVVKLIVVWRITSWDQELIQLKTVVRKQLPLFNQLASVGRRDDISDRHWCRMQACKLLQKFCKHKQVSTGVFFCKGQILQDHSIPLKVSAREVVLGLLLKMGASPCWCAAGHKTGPLAFHLNDK